MPLSSVPKHERGFTLVEVLIVLSIVGILTAIGVPSLLSLLNAKKVDNALTRVESALKEAQKTAIKKSKTCTVTIPTGVARQLSSNCLAAGDLSLEDVNIARPSSLATIAFDFKGRVNDPGNRGTIVLSLPDGSMPKKCLAISTGIGLIRTGNYDGSKCNTI
jgi:type II secretion system protein H